jgi:SAM-dependent methyltransferase
MDTTRLYFLGGRDFAMANRFSEIYESNVWEHGSGEGSLEVHTRGYRDFLQEFLVQKKISSVVDMGCGDWQFSRLINWNGARYQGFDVVPTVIAANKEKFANHNVSFDVYSGNPMELPQADLLIAKDVLQHLPNQTVVDFLPYLSKYKYALLTNCVNPKGETRNVDIELGEFRPLDLRLAPFHLKSSPVFSFDKNEISLYRKLRALIRGYPKWKKVVLLVDNANKSQVHLQ